MRGKTSNIKTRQDRHILRQRHHYGKIKMKYIKKIMFCRSQMLKRLMKSLPRRWRKSLRIFISTPSEWLLL